MVGEDLIPEAVRTNECRFDSPADALLALKDAGISEKIILAVLIDSQGSKGILAAGRGSSSRP
jgi:hypothetical protein